MLQSPREEKEYEKLQSQSRSVGEIGAQRGKVEGEAGAWLCSSLQVESGTDVEFILKTMADC